MPSSNEVFGRQPNCVIIFVNRVIDAETDVHHFGQGVKMFHGVPNAIRQIARVHEFPPSSAVDPNFNFCLTFGNCLRKLLNSCRILYKRFSPAHSLHLSAQVRPSKSSLQSKVYSVVARVHARGREVYKFFYIRLICAANDIATHVQTFRQETERLAIVNRYASDKSNSLFKGVSNS